MKTYLFDTDILIDHLRGSEKATNFLVGVIEKGCFISPITVAELFAGVREGKERDALELFVQQFQIAGLDIRVALQGGLFRRDYGKSHGVGLADAIIAATAIELNACLVTLNKKHYPMLEHVRTPY